MTWHNSEAGQATGQTGDCFLKIHAALLIYWLISAFSSPQDAGCCVINVFFQFSIKSRPSKVIPPINRALFNSDTGQIFAWLQNHSRLHGAHAFIKISACRDAVSRILKVRAYACLIFFVCWPLSSSLAMQRKNLLFSEELLLSGCILIVSSLCF